MRATTGTGLHIRRRRRGTTAAAVVVVLVAALLTAMASSAVAARTPGALVAYDFTEGAGVVVGDSGRGEPLDLTIADPGSVSWVDGGGLTIDSETVVSSGVAASKVSDAVVASGEITLEAWVVPANTTQAGPARVVSVSGGSSSRNVTLGQGLYGGLPSTVFDVRFRSSETNGSGTPSTTTPAGTVSTELQHVVFTRGAGGATTIYVDGAVVATGDAGGDLSNWSGGFPLVLANEVGASRPWLGTLCGVAIYDQALTSTEVGDNHAAGCGGVASNADPVVTGPGDQSSAEGDVVDLAVVAEDDDGDVLSFAATGLPEGLSIGESSGVVSGTIGQQAAAGSPYDVEVTVDDGRGGSASVSLEWSVSVVNVDPVLDGIVDQLSSLDVALELAVSASDVDGDELVHDATGLPDGLSIDPVSGVIAGTPTVQGEFDVTVAVDDGQGGDVSTSFTWTIVGNDPPEVEAVADQSSDEGEEISLQVSATDPDGDEVAFAATGLPDGLSIGVSSGQITGTIGQQAAVGSPYEVDVTVSDPAGASTAVSLEWTVAAVNVAPAVTGPGDQSSVEGDEVSVAIGVVDADGDDLSFDATGLPDGLSIGPDGVVVGAIAAGAAGGSPYAVEVTVDDGTDQSTVAFAWTVVEVTGPQPVVAYDFTEGAGVVVGDSGRGEPLDLTIADPGSVSWVDGGGLTIDSETVVSSGVAASKVSDAVVASGEITLEAWVVPANTTQAGPARVVSVSGGSSSRNVTLGQGLYGGLPSTVFDVRFRSSETNGSGTPSTTTPAGTVSTELQHVVFTRGAGGTTTIYVDGAVVATGDAGGDLSNWSGGFPLVLANEVGASRPWLGTLCGVAIYDQALTSTEVGDNHAAGCGGVASNADPVVTGPGDQSSAEGDVVDLAVVAEDDDGDVLSFAATGLPEGLSIGESSGVVSGTIGQQAAAGSPYDVEVTVDDGRGGSASVSLEWSVSVVNVDPVLDGIVDQLSSLDVALELAVSASDVDGDELVHDATGLPDGLSIDPVSGVIAGTPTVQGEFDVTVAVDDGQGGDVSTSFTWTIVGNDPPEVEAVADQSSDEGEEISLQVSATDPDGDEVAFAATGLPDGLSIGVSSGQITGTIGQQAAVGSPYEVDVTVSDPAGASTAVSLEWTVAAVNVAPAVTGPGDQSSVEGDEVSVAIGVVDADGDDLSFDATGLPDGLSIGPDGVVVGAIAAGAAGGSPYAVEVTVDDGTDQSTVAFAWTVVEVTGPQPVVAYDFTEGAGVVVGDSGRGEPLDLTIADPGSVSWVDGGGLTIDSETVVSSGVAASKVSDAVVASGEITLEAWVVPANTTQAGPARVVSVSGGSSSRNVTLGQGLYGGLPSTVFDVRFRSSETNGSGTPSTTTPAGTVSTELQHVVFTRGAGGTTTIYVDGAVVATGDAGGDLSNWSGGFPLVLANEVGASRPWLGTLCGVAIYDQALTSTEVGDNHAAGCGPRAAGTARVQVTPDSGIAATTYGNQTITISNEGVAGSPSIESVSLNLRGSIVPDATFDPIGTAGDEGTQCLDVSSGAVATGFVVPPDPCADPFSLPHEDAPGVIGNGWDGMTLDFTDFGVGESIVFGVDVDPTTIQGVPGSGGAGAVSGLELAGSAVTVVFSDGTLSTTQLFADGSDGGGQGVASPVVGRVAPTGIEMVGVTTTPTVFPNDAVAGNVATTGPRTVRVSGPVGAEVTLLSVAGEYPEPDAFDLDPYETDEAVDVDQPTATIGADGTVDFAVDVADDDLLYHYVAAIDDGATGMLSDVLVIAVGDTDTPVIDALGDVVVDEGETVQVDVAATDPNGDGLALSLSSTPDLEALGASFTDAGDGTGTLEWDTEVGDAGSYVVDVTASDGTNVAVASFTITVLDGSASGGSAVVAIDPGAGIEASTYGAGSFAVSNTSAGGQTITGVTLDLSTAVLPDLVFDPAGLAGDATAKCVEVGGGATATGYVTPGDPCTDPFSQPHNGADDGDGWDAVTADFGDFDAGETFTFAVDVDPNSIKNAGGSGNAGSVSGLELAGTTVTVAFSDGTVVAETFRSGTSNGASSVAVSAEPRETAVLAVAGVTLVPQPELSPRHAAATVGSPTQTIEVTGPAGGTVRLVRLESALVQTPGYDVDPYEANTVVAVEAYDVPLDGTGAGSVEVTLTDTATGATATDDTGLNYFMAVVGDGAATGPVSNVVVLDLGAGPVAIDDAASVAPGGVVVIDVLANDTSDVGLDPATVAITGGPSGGYTAGPDPITGAITYNPENGFDVANGDSFTYTVDDLNGATSNEATVAISDSTAVGEVLFRVNAGGPQVAAADGGLPWTEDQSASSANNAAELGTPSPYVNWDVGGATADTTYGVAASTVIDLAQVAGTGAAVEALYETERYREPAAGEPPMTWTFPVTAGDYEVVLVGAEVWNNEAANPRVMDVAVEGATEVAGLRWSTSAGANNTATSVVVPATVTDGDLVVELLAVSQNPKLSAIEIRSAGPPPTDVPPTVAAIDDQQVQEGATLDVPVTTAEPDGDVVTLVADIPAEAADFTTFADAGDGTGSFTVAPAAGDAGSYDLAVTASDPDGDDTESFTVTVTDAPAAGTVFTRINAGGPQVAAIDGGPAWEDDTGETGHPYLVEPGSGNTNGFAPLEPGPTVPSTVPGAVFDTERWSNSGFAYGVPVPAGTQVYVRLFLGNGYPGTSEPGQRVFDVSIDGEVVAGDLDLSDAYGHEVGGMLEYLVTSDGTLDVAFSNVVENPLVNALEVVSAESSPGQLGVSPTTVDFGQTLVGGTNPRTVTLSNLGFEAGDPDIEVTDVAVSGGDFAVTGGTGTLAAGTSTTLQVTFSPSSVGPSTGTLTISHDGDSSPVEVDLSGVGASDIPVSFGSSGLSGESSGNPTSLEFGPDGRLYVSQQNGLIYAYEVERNGPNDYDVVGTEQIDEVKQITNHDDDGSVNTGQNNRQVTGLMTAGTDTNPVLYVTSSDPRIGAGGGGNDTGLDTNSGVLSRVTWTGTQWERVDLVRGLPRSEENHATNGIDLDPVTNTLYLMQGGHANKGAPSNNFAGTSEYYLSAAMLSIDLDALDAMPVVTDAQGNDRVYDLPTLVDPTRDDTATDPFGGNNGLNQAIPEPGGPVQIYSPGYRNAYDVVFTSLGRLYTSDNGPNGGWGGVPLIYDSTGALKGHELQNGVDFDEGAGDYCTNDFNEDGSNGHGDPLHFVSGPGYYGGHPTPIRAFPGEAGVKVYVDGGANWNLADDEAFGDLLPAGLSLADFPDNPVECTYSANDPSKVLDTIGASTNGITEYTASNFGGAMQGNLLTASFNGNIYRYQLNAAGDDLRRQARRCSAASAASRWT